MRWTPTGPDVVTGLDLDLLPGHRVALVGPSGSGKTTVAMALLRLLDPSSGRITLGGVDTADLDGDDVRRVVGLLAQDAYVFDSTVLENVRLARPDATDRAGPGGAGRRPAARLGRRAARRPGHLGRPARGPDVRR